MIASAFLDAMSKDLIDRSNLIKSLEAIKTVVKNNTGDKGFIDGIDTAITMVKLQKTEY